MTTRRSSTSANVNAVKISTNVDSRGESKHKGENANVVKISTYVDALVVAVFDKLSEGYYFNHFRFQTSLLYGWQ